MFVVIVYRRCLWEPLVDTGLAARRVQNRTLELLVPACSYEPELEPVLEPVQLGLFVCSVPLLAVVAEFLELVTC
jgi:hypothetical protein